MMGNNKDLLPVFRETPDNWHELEHKRLSHEAVKLRNYVDFFRTHYYQANMSLRPLDISLMKLTGNQYVYVLHDPATEYYKFGRSSNPTLRINGQRGGAPVAFEVIAIIPCRDMAWAEKHIHAQYARYRKNGEWFEVSSKQVINAITQFAMFYVYENMQGNGLVVIEDLGIK